MNKDWLSWKDAFKEENVSRLNTNSNSLCTYGIRPLDEALFRIAKNELIVIGADSGVGKSELSLSIARHNAMNGKNVAVYYLEGGHLEAITRMKWKDIADRFYRDLERGHQNNIYKEIDFKKWLFNHGELDHLHAIEQEIYGDYTEKYKDNLFFYPITDKFDVEKLTMSLLDFSTLEPDENDNGLLGYKYSLDLIVIDHLQYFSLDKDETEIQEITKILRTVKMITDSYHIPVILISHLRKKHKDRGIPGQEDFYGSSNIPKIATTAITIAPAPNKENLAGNIYPTYLRIAKSRTGVKPNYAMLVNFDLNRREYESKYKIYRLDSYGNVSDNALKDEELPRWAEGARML